MSNPQNQSEAASFRLTGRSVFFIIFGFFVIVILVNAYMAYMAIGTFRGEDTKQSYLQGLHYNQTIEARHHQNELGWRAKLHIENGMIDMAITGRDGTPITGLTLTGVLKHPSETDLDHKLVFVEQSNGHYTAHTGGITGGRHLLTETRAADGTVFKTRNDNLWLK